MQTSSPLFSVILPVYNRAEMIEGTIVSILKQEYTDFELIIVDDGSSDQIADVIMKLPDPRIRFYRKNNEERAVARNYGASKSTGIFLNFFDSDDRMYPNHLQAAADFIRINPHTVFFHHGYDNINGKGEKISTETGVSSKPQNRLIQTNYLGCDSVFISRKVFEDIEFNPDRRLSSSEDWDLWLKLICRYPLMNSGIVTFQMINHGGRSLFNISADRVIERDTVLVDSLMSDPEFKSTFKNEIGIFRADRFTFFSLCLIIEQRHKEAFWFLMNSVRCSLKVFLRKRFWACMKHLVLNRLR